MGPVCVYLHGLRACVSGASFLPELDLWVLYMHVYPLWNIQTCESCAHAHLDLWVLCVPLWNVDSCGSCVYFSPWNVDLWVLCVFSSVEYGLVDPVCVSSMECGLVGPVYFPVGIKTFIIVICCVFCSEQYS